MTASFAADRSPKSAEHIGGPLIAGALRRIAQFADLESDWDSYGGEPPSPIARDEAGRWVEIVADLFGSRAGDAVRPYSVAPLADGGVQIEWRGRHGVVELEVGPSGELGYLFLAQEGPVPRAEEVEDASWSDVLRALLRALGA
jgi:hypothetical protein